MTKSLNNKKYDLELFTPGSWLFEEGNIGEKGNNHHQSKSNGDSNVKIDNINHNFLPDFLALKASIKKTIPNTTSIVNTPKLIDGGFWENAETMKPAPNQPADKLTNKSETIENQIGSVFIINNLVRQKQLVNARSIQRQLAILIGGSLMFQNSTIYSMYYIILYTFI